MPTYNIVVFGGDYAGPEVCYSTMRMPIWFPEDLDACYTNSSSGDQ